MNLNMYFESIISQDLSPVVVCDINHTIVYMNPSAIKMYENRGGDDLIGRSLLECHNPNSAFKISEVLHWFLDSKDNNIIHTFYDEKNGKDGYMIALRDKEGNLIGYYEKHALRYKDETPFYCFG